MDLYARLLGRASRPAPPSLRGVLGTDLRAPLRGGWAQSTANTPVHVHFFRVALASSLTSLLGRFSLSGRRVACYFTRLAGVTPCPTLLPCPTSPRRGVLIPQVPRTFHPSQVQGQGAGPGPCGSGAVQAWAHAPPGSVPPTFCSPAGSQGSLVRLSFFGGRWGLGWGVG